MDIHFELKRLPETNHPSLKAWNAADELMVLHELSEVNQVGIYNDPFGFLSCHLIDQNPFVITDLKSQEMAIRLNLETNNLNSDSTGFFRLTDELPRKIDLAYLKIPKSLTLLETYLQHIHAHLIENGQVICGFMTRYFNSGILDISQKYFENVSQSQAKKKARLLFLSGKKSIESPSKTESFKFQGLNIEQYRGVFSSGKVDKATNFLLQNLVVPEKHNNVLDLACGNGIIGRWAMKKAAIPEMHFLDDSHLALESAKLNLSEEKAHFHHHFQLDEFENNSLDWIITNPPFHFENTIDISVPIGLFKASYPKLKDGGILTIVCNSNLRYEAVLKGLFKSVKIQKSNRQFKIYNCLK